MLYFIGTGDKIKIGYSSVLDDRLGTLQTGNADKLRILLALRLRNEREIEGLLHERLDYCRAEGEWFKISFANALDHLVEIRNQLDTGDRKELLLESKPKPRLDDYQAEFEQWLRTDYLRNGWNEGVYPIWYLWEVVGGEFLCQREAKMN